MTTMPFCLKWILKDYKLDLYFCFVRRLFKIMYLGFLVLMLHTHVMNSITDFPMCDLGEKFTDFPPYEEGKRLQEISFWGSRSL